MCDTHWTTLEHNGAYFFPPYDPMPKSIKVLYDGKPVELDKYNTKNPFNTTAEEAAYYYAQQLEADIRHADKPGRHAPTKNKIFNANFWKDWKKILGPRHVIKDLKKVDFTPMVNYIAHQAEQKKSLTKEEKAEKKELKQQIADYFQYAIVDGEPVKIDYAVEQPGLYQGHGEQPLQGKIKRRIIPSDITINLSKNAPIPEPKYYIRTPDNKVVLAKSKWGKVVHKNDVLWLFKWTNSITGRATDKRFNRNECTMIQKKDLEKFEKARKLAKNITKIRKAYMKDIKSKDSALREVATAIYLLDVLAIRPGSDKDEEKESDTLGLTTLTYDTITFEANNHITLAFKGKSSIDFSKTFSVDPTVYKNLAELQKLAQRRAKKSKNKKDAQLFINTSPSTLNSYLKEIVSGITAKVFRTSKASSILQEQLNELKVNVNFDNTTKKIMYNRANLEVAKALNHKKMTVNSTQVPKIKEKIKQAKADLKQAKAEYKASGKSPGKVDRATTKVEKLMADLEIAEGNVALGTSKLNYLDPRITMAWAKKVEIPIEKLYSKANMTKFAWATETPPDWQF